ncbi:MAG: class II fructose-bisphosphate aldolase, partial [Patescibacteria group bacterium]
MLVHIKELVEDAEKEGYALGAFNILNIEMALGVAYAAEKTGSPVIFQVSQNVIEYMGVKPITHIVSTIAKNIAVQVPVALHLDHGKSFDAIFECINSGFTSVHIDASSLPYDENVNLTRHVVEVARPKGVWVQGELGEMIGGHGQSGNIINNVPIADPDKVAEFVKATKIDTVAAPIGTAHGVYENERVDLEVLKAIKERISIPFVLHGGSGVKSEDMKKAVAMGVNIINIGSDLKIAFSKKLIETCVNNKEETDPRVLLKPTIEAVE